MRYLLDTHVLLWARSAPALLKADALAIFGDPDCALHVSVASLWECAIKCSVGKLALPDGFYRIVAEDYEIADIDMAHLEAYGKLPMHHRDPFDRLLVVQAQLGGFTLFSRDDNIPRYNVTVLNA